MTLVIECFGVRGLSEVEVSCTLPEAIEMVETRIGEIMIDRLVIKGIGKLTPKMWAEKTGSSNVVSVDWMWVGRCI